MVSHSTIAPSKGSTKARKRVGRGNGSGKGTYAGRGVKGQGARTGVGKFNAAFEGGQTPLFRRLPKARGFTKWNQVEFNVVNLSDLEELATAGITKIDSIVLIEKGIIRSNGSPLKLLARGVLTQAVTVTANKASKTALAALEKAGGKIELI
jgi:large subunit ribosomal protein L15